jgi:CRP/FNR family cyclic AMP-dependent transcriptional regulator
MKTILDLLKECSFFSDLSHEELEFIASCGRLVHFCQGEKIASYGDSADSFFLIRDGKVALSIETLVERPFLFKTLGPFDIVGLSWLIPPYRWTSSAYAQTEVKALAFHGKCIREKCEKDHHLGFKLMKHLLQVMVEREDALKLHLIDIYGKR